MSNTRIHATPPYYVQRVRVSKPPSISRELYNCFYYIVEEFTDAVIELRSTSNLKIPIEVEDVPDQDIDTISIFSEREVGELYCMATPGMENKKISIKIKEVFILIILELGISFKRAESYFKLEKVIMGFSGDENLEIASDICLSTLLKHYYDGKEEGKYFNLSNEKYNRIALTSTNCNYFFYVATMANFLARKSALIIDYEEFNEIGKEGQLIVQNFDLKNLHKSGDIFYNNKWPSHEKFTNNAKRNMLMAVLSYLKFKMYGYENNSYDF